MISLEYSKGESCEKNSYHQFAQSFNVGLR